MARAWIVLGLVLLFPRATIAEGQHDRSVHYWEVGKGFFDAERYAEAIEQFSAGYALDPSPVFLFNIGVCHQHLGHLADARDYFVKFIKRAPNDNPLLARARIELEDVERHLAASHPAPGVAAHILTAPSAASIAPPKRHRRWWIVPTVVGGIALLAGAGVAIYFAERPTWCNPAQVTCFDAR